VLYKACVLSILLCFGVLLFDIGITAESM